MAAATAIVSGTSMVGMSLSATRSTSSATLGASQLAPLRNGGRVVAVKATSAYSEVSPTLILLALV
jgi:hypothetical protein